jgi:uncharacterized membrane protein (UPF0127 family)
MPSNAIAKTKSAPRTRAVFALVAVGILLCVVFAWQQWGAKTRTLQVGKASYTLEQAITSNEQKQGLSGRRAMSKNHGMLFVFQHEDQQCFWMKDMHFPLDIIWMDADRRVVFLAQYVDPSTYPRTFCSGDPAAYVIELPAGAVQRLRIHKGQVLNF